MERGEEDDEEEGVHPSPSPFLLLLLHVDVGVTPILHIHSEECRKFAETEREKQPIIMFRLDPRPTVQHSLNLAATSEFCHFRTLFSSGLYAGGPKKILFRNFVSD